MKAYGNRLIVVPTKEKPSGVLLTVEDKSPTNTGIVASVGPLVENFKPKDSIFFNGRHAIKVKVKGEEVYILSEEDCYGHYS